MIYSSSPQYFLIPCLPTLCFVPGKQEKREKSRHKYIPIISRYQRVPHHLILFLSCYSSSEYSVIFLQPFFVGIPIFVLLYTMKMLRKG